MEKRLKTNQKTSAPALRKETLRRLEEVELRAAGAARIYVPIGRAEDTTPIYSYVDLP
jgi:hypothetical protein